MSKWIKWTIKRIVGIAIFTWILPIMWILEWVMEDDYTIKQAIQKTWRFYKEEALGIKDENGRTV